MSMTYRERQHGFRRACFGPSASSPLVRHSFGVDHTHNLCCDLGPKSKRYADASGNRIGALSESIDRGSKSTSAWSTCMGSNVCTAYASKFRDGTHARFATNKALTKLITDIPSNPDCEAYAATLLSAPRHGTPGIRTRGDPSKCKEKERVRKSMITDPTHIETWIKKKAPKPPRSIPSLASSLNLDGVMTPKLRAYYNPTGA